MTISKDSGRQWPLVAMVRFSFGDIVTAVAAEAVDLPADAVVVGGGVVVETVWNSATSDVLDVGDGADTNRYSATAVNLQALGHTALDVTGYKYPESDTVDALLTSVGAAATQGAGYLYVEYIREDRSNENM